MYLSLFILIVSVMFNSCEPVYSRFGIPEDNIIEEAVEDIIKHETGIVIDITPESKEY